VGTGKRGCGAKAKFLRLTRLVGGRMDDEAEGKKVCWDPVREEKG